MNGKNFVYGVESSLAADLSNVEAKIAEAVEETVALAEGVACRPVENRENLECGYGGGAQTASPSSNTLRQQGG
jgi:hypothetical protein